MMAMAMMISAMVLLNWMAFVVEAGDAPAVDPSLVNDDIIGHDISRLDNAGRNDSRLDSPSHDNANQNDARPVDDSGLDDLRQRTTCADLTCGQLQALTATQCQDLSAFCLSTLTPPQLACIPTDCWGHLGLPDVEMLSLAVVRHLAAHVLTPRNLPTLEHLVYSVLATRHGHHLHPTSWYALLRNAALVRAVLVPFRRLYLAELSRTFPLKVLDGSVLSELCDDARLLDMAWIEQLATHHVSALKPAFWATLSAEQWSRIPSDAMSVVTAPIVQTLHAHDALRSLTPCQAMMLGLDAQDVYRLQLRARTSTLAGVDLDVALREQPVLWILLQADVDGDSAGGRKKRIDSGYFANGHTWHVLRERGALLLDLWLQVSDSAHEVSKPPVANPTIPPRYFLTAAMATGGCLLVMLIFLIRTAVFC
jgi:hypothetical protein